MDPAGDMTEAEAEMCEAEHRQPRYNNSPPAAHAHTDTDTRTHHAYLPTRPTGLPRLLPVPSISACSACVLCLCAVPVL